MFEAFAFGAGLDGVAEFALQTAALCEDRVELCWALLCFGMVVPLCVVIGGFDARTLKR